MRAKAGRPPTRKAPKRKPGREPCFYLACFYFDEPGEEEWTGSFQVFVEATSPEEAVERCQRRLRKLRATTTLFDTPITIYIEGIVKLAGSFENGLLVNWDAGRSSERPDVRLTNMIPNQTDHEAIDYGWRPNGKRRKSKKIDDGETIEPFLDFGGMTFRRALEKAKGEREPERPAVTSPIAPKSRLPLIPPVHPRTMPRDTGPPRETARAQKQARKERRAAIATTLDELRGGPTTEETGSKPRRG